MSLHFHDSDEEQDDGPPLELPSSEAALSLSEWPEPRKSKKIDKTSAKQAAKLHGQEQRTEVKTTDGEAETESAEARALPQVSDAQLKSALQAICALARAASSHPDRALSVLRQFDTRTLINVSSSAEHIAHYLSTGQIKALAHDSVHARGRAALSSLFPSHSASASVSASASASAGWAAESSDAKTDAKTKGKGKETANEKEKEGKSKNKNKRARTEQGPSSATAASKPAQPLTQFTPFRFRCGPLSVELLSALPDVLLVHCLSFLPVPDLASFGQTWYVLVFFSVFVAVFCVLVCVCVHLLCSFGVMCSAAGRYSLLLSAANQFIWKPLAGACLSLSLSLCVVVPVSLCLSLVLCVQCVSFLITSQRACSLLPLCPPLLLLLLRKQRPRQTRRKASNQRAKRREKLRQRHTETHKQKRKHRHQHQQEHHQW